MACVGDGGDPSSTSTRRPRHGSALRVAAVRSRRTPNVRTAPVGSGAARALGTATGAGFLDDPDYVCSGASAARCVPGRFRALRAGERFHQVDLLTIWCPAVYFSIPMHSEVVAQSAERGASERLLRQRRQRRKQCGNCFGSIRGSIKGGASAGGRGVTWPPWTTVLTYGDGAASRFSLTYRGISKLHLHSSTRFAQRECPGFARGVRPAGELGPPRAERH
jgi:hypothetical protein